jgi:hypothetical protein
VRCLLPLLALLAGCLTGETPAGRLVDSAAAVDQVLLSYHFVTTGGSDWRPEVFLVRPDNCGKDGTPTFIRPDNGKCVKGLFVPEWFGPGNIYLADPGTNRFHDTSLAHEVLHFLGFDHPEPGNWGPDSPERLCINHANKVLTDLPAADKIDLEKS